MTCPGAAAAADRARDAGATPAMGGVAQLVHVPRSPPSSLLRTDDHDRPGQPPPEGAACEYLVLPLSYRSRWPPFSSRDAAMTAIPVRPVPVATRTSLSPGSCGPGR